MLSLSFNYFDLYFLKDKIEITSEIRSIHLPIDEFERIIDVLKEGKREYVGRTFMIHTIRTIEVFVLQGNDYVYAFEITPQEIDRLQTILKEIKFIQK